LFQQCHFLFHELMYTKYSCYNLAVVHHRTVDLKRFSSNLSFFGEFCIEVIVVTKIY
jgi:hypothetical protein